MLRKKLSIISSSSNIIKSITEILKEENYDFSVISDNILEQIQMIKPDFIILDIAVLDLAVEETVKKIWQKTSRSAIPIVLVTNGKKLYSFGDFPLMDIITFPLVKEELLARVKHLKVLADEKKSNKKKKAKLKLAIHSQEKLISIIAHDLRAPIGTIKMINEAILTEKEKIRNAGIRKKIEMVSETTEEAYNLLENLLRWSRNQSGQTKIMPVKFDIAVIVRKVLSLFKGYAQNKNISIQNLTQENTIVYADEDMVKTILRNLISNAIKFTKSGGKVCVRSQEKEGEIEIAVEDNGIGIKKEHQEKLLKESSKNIHYGTINEKGSGLGLILCRDFIKMNNGRFYFTSKVNKGSVFYFTLPKG